MIYIPNNSEKFKINSENFNIVETHKSPVRNTCDKANHHQKNEQCLLIRPSATAIRKYSPKNEKFGVWGATFRNAKFCQKCILVCMMLVNVGYASALLKNSFNAKMYDVLCHQLMIMVVLGVAYLFSSMVAFFAFLKIRNITLSRELSKSVYRFNQDVLQGVSSANERANPDNFTFQFVQAK